MIGGNEIQNYLKKEFSNYYKSNQVKGPPRLNEREFGFGLFGQKISSRHLSFADSKELNEFLVKDAPFYFSSSVAYYHFPDARPMEAKEWKGGDLVFEFDADDLKTECSEKHTFWKCPSCKKEGIGLAELCDSCGAGLKAEEWPCPKCLDEVKKELFRLLDLLEIDLGLTEGYSFNFSGSKGFHVHIRAKEIEFLSPKARVELVDYLTANGLETQTLGFYFDKKTMFCPKEKEAKGWQKILLNELKHLIEEEKFEELAAWSGFGNAQVKRIFYDKEKVLSDLSKGFLQPFTPLKKTGEAWERVLKRISERKKILLDRSTSIDSRKIVRVPNTLHGSTGLLAKELSFNELKEFNAFDEAVVFNEGELKVSVKKTPEFYLSNSLWGPFKEKEEIVLPKAVAVYLLLRGNAYGFEL
jgi:DNA primase small subunit